MPILIWRKHLYTNNWNQIREKVLKRANESCEVCGRKNGSYDFNHHYQMIQIRLAVHHIDHDPENNDLANLKALCQRCHLKADEKERWENRRLNKDWIDGQKYLFNPKKGYESY